MKHKEHKYYHLRPNTDIATIGPLSIWANHGSRFLKLHVDLIIRTEDYIEYVDEKDMKRVANKFANEKINYLYAIYANIAEHKEEVKKGIKEYINDKLIEANEPIKYEECE